MTRHDTTLLFVTYGATCAGTAMAKAIKEFARNEFKDTIIDEYQRHDVVDAIKQHAQELAIANPKWKQSEISLQDDTCGGAFHRDAKIYWLRVDGETVLTMVKASGNYAMYSE